MNKFERQGHHPADIKTLPETTAGDPTPLPGEVIELSDAPPIAPQVPLTPSEVRTILMSLLLTMFLAALDQTIVATALPTIGRQFNDVTSLSWVISAYLLASTAVAPVFGTLSDIYGGSVASPLIGPGVRSATSVSWTIETSELYWLIKAIYEFTCRWQDEMYAAVIFFELPKL